MKFSVNIITIISIKKKFVTFDYMLTKRRLTSKPCKKMHGG